jgi:glyoxylase I family protein
MTSTSETVRSEPGAAAEIKLQRLHHLAYTTYDMAATRHFYEDVIGMPLLQTWVEGPDDGPFAGRRYVHCFFGLADGGAIAYFEFPDRTEPENRPPTEGHIAFKTDADTQRAIHERLLADGCGPEDLRLMDHGYCVSLYVTDPSGLRLELTVDHDEIDKIVAYQAGAAHDELRRWQGGDQTPNNAWRPAGH